MCAPALAVRFFNIAQCKTLAQYLALTSVLAEGLQPRQMTVSFNLHRLSLLLDERLPSQPIEAKRENFLLLQVIECHRYSCAILF